MRVAADRILLRLHSHIYRCLSCRNGHLVIVGQLTVVVAGYCDDQRLTDIGNGIAGNGERGSVTLLDRTILRRHGQ